MASASPGMSLSPQAALTTAVLSMEAVGWMYTFPETPGRAFRGGQLTEASRIRGGPAPGSHCLPGSPKSVRVSEWYLG